MRKKFKVLGFILAVFFGVSLAITLSLPTVLSTRWGKAQAVKLVNSQIPGSITVNNVSLSWIGSQVFEGVTLKSLEGETIFSFDSFQTRTPLIKFLLQGPSLGKVELKGLFLNIVEEYPDVTNLQQALGKKEIKFNNKRDNLFIQLPLTTKIALKTKKPRNFRKPEPIVFKDVNLSVDSTTFAKPIEFSLKGTSQQGDLLGEFAIDAVFTSGFTKHWRFNRNAEVKIKADVKNFPVDMLDIALTHDHPDYQGIMRDVIGDRISLKVDQALSSRSGDFTITTQSPTFTANMVASLQDEKFTLVETGNITFILTPELFDRIASRGRTTSLVRLTNPTITRMTIDALSLPIDFEDFYPNAINFAGLSMKAKLVLDDTNLTGSPLWGDIAVREVISTIETSENSQNAIWRLRGEANQNGQHLPIKLDATIYKPKEDESFFDSIRKQTNLHVELAGVPLVKLDLFDSNLFIGNLFGSNPCLKIDLESKGELSFLRGVITSDNKLSAVPSLHFKGEYFNSALNLEFWGDTAKKGNVNGHIRTSGSHFEGRICADKLTLIDPSHGTPLELKSFTAEAKNGKAGLDFLIKAEPVKGSLLLNVSYGENSVFDMKLRDCPLSPFAAFFVPKWQIHSHLETLFGDRVNGYVRGSLIKGDGPVLFDLDGPKGKFFADTIIKDGMAYLNQPLKGHMFVTPKLGKKVLSSISPLFRCELESDKPILFTVAPERFVFPCHHFSWDQVQMPQAMIQIGKMAFKHSSEMQSLLELLEIDTKESVPLWFTPIYFSVANGVIHLNRVDLLLMEQFPLATWGYVDPARNKVNMVLGITQEALQKAFAIESLPADYMLQLPLEGKLKDAKIDKRRAAASIGALMTKNFVEIKDPLLNSFVDFAVNELIGRQAAPPPTTTPFPWSSYTFEGV